MFFDILQNTLPPRTCFFYLQKRLPPRLCFLEIIKKRLPPRLCFLETNKNDFRGGSLFESLADTMPTTEIVLTLVKPHAHYGNEMSLVPNTFLRRQCFI